jgi:TolB-like protein/predicted Ser/Thr protein kinase
VVAPTAAAEGPTIMSRLQAGLAERYRVDRELGKGGMAVVYLAHDIRHDRDVAIKVLHPELAATVGAERFGREIKLAAKLQHPHILSLYDSGETDGLLFYVMPFVQGESLRDRIDRDGMLPVDEAVGLTIEVAEALGHAHSLGVVHRDIKPENILLSNGHALVADFGIARAVSEAGDRKLTQTGTAVGTPLYMSPEQSMGDEVGPPSDLYSLACVAYELLTGQPPFTGSTARAIMARHTMEMVPSLQVVRETVSDEVEAALMWALAKVPADRPQNAAAFIEALGTPLGAAAARRGATRARMTTPRLTGMQRLTVPWWRRRVTLLAAGVAVLALGSGAAVMLRGGTGAAADGRDPRNLGVLYFDDLSPGGELRWLADASTEGLITALGRVRELNVVSRNGSEQARELAQHGAALDSIGRYLGVGTLVAGSIEPVGGDVRVSLRLMDGFGVDYPRARASFQLPAADLIAMLDTLVAEAQRLVRAQLGAQVSVQRQLAGTGEREAWVLAQRAERLSKQMDSAAHEGDTLLVQRHWSQADSLLALAEQRDARWLFPKLLRAGFAYRRSRYLADDPTSAGRWIATGLTHVERALERERDNADALELRGNLRYWSWLLGLETDAVRARRLLEGAQADLERAGQLNPAQAGAFATLSHLYNQVESKGGVDIIAAARQALEADAFLSNAGVILHRRFLAGYDVGQFPDARSTCEEGSRRFPADARFAECRLWLMTQPRLRPEDYDVARAWRLVDSVVTLSSVADTAFRVRQSRMAVAAVLARAGQADSARRVVSRSMGDALIDPTSDLSNTAAFVYTILADTAAAVAQVQRYLSANPGRRAALAAEPGWWFRDIASHPGYRQATAVAR